MAYLTIHSEENLAESIDISVDGLVEQLSYSEMGDLVDEIELKFGIYFDEDDYTKLPKPDNIYNAEWIDAIRKLSEGRYRLSVDDEMIIKQIADKL